MYNYIQIKVILYLISLYVYLLGTNILTYLYEVKKIECEKEVVDM